jgi:hypothetical protein
MAFMANLASKGASQNRAVMMINEHRSCQSWGEARKLEKINKIPCNKLPGILLGVEENHYFQCASSPQQAAGYSR